MLRPLGSGIIIVKLDKIYLQFYHKMIKYGKIVKEWRYMYEKFTNIINNNNGIITAKEAEKKGI